MLKVSRHLMKKGPLYTDQHKRIVKLLHVYKTRDGLGFATEIMSGEHKGKCGQSYKKDLKLFKNETVEQMVDYLSLST